MTRIDEVLVELRNLNRSIINARFPEPSKEGVTQDIDTKVDVPDVETEESLLERLKTEFKVFFAISAVIFLVFLIVQWYPTYVINGLNESLAQPSLQIEEIWRLQGSLGWWNLSLVTIFKPLSTLLIATSMMLSGYFTIRSIDRIAIIELFIRLAHAQAIAQARERTHHPNNILNYI